jgi:hypothetical protein
MPTTSCLRAGGLSLAALCISASTVPAQLNSLTTPVDGRTIALGESFTGTRGDLATMFYNPAGIAGIEGLHATYSQRSMDWISYLSDFRYSSIQAAVQTPVAVFGAFYHRLNYGELTVRTATNPLGVGKTSPYDHTLGVTGAFTAFPGFDVGVSVKGYQYVDLPAAVEGTDGVAETSTSWAVMVDLGALYTLSLATGPFSHDIGVGASLQNFGSNAVLSTGSGNTTASEQPARFLRLGVSYSLAVVPPSENGLTPCRLTATGEYRNILNTRYFANAERDYYGWGVELWGFEILALRAGWFLSNIDWIYGTAGEPKVRYGAGVHLPMHKLGLSIPLAIRGDYAVIKLREAYGWLGNAKSTLNAFTIGISYEGNVFE